MYSCIFLTTYYDTFMESFYQKRPFLAKAPYYLQLKMLYEEFFGDSDFYSQGLKTAGWKAEDLIINCQPLLKAWGEENDFSGNSVEVIVEQIRKAKPDVIYIHDMNALSKEFLTTVRPYTKIIAGQAGTIINNGMPYTSYDLIFSCLPYYVDHFRSEGMTAYYQPLAIDPRVVKNLRQSEFNQRSINCSFVGGISNLHKTSYELLEMLAKETCTDFWGYGTESLPDDSPIRKRHHGQVWGKEMFALLALSKLTINRHGELARNYAANMRLYEATGCGALLITDYKDNLNELFEIGEEVVAYRSPEECAALVKYYLANPIEAEEISRSGQKRTLRDHTYAKRMDQTAEILGRHLKYTREKGRFPVPDMSKITYGHTLIEPIQISESMISAWKSEEIPEKQRALVQQSLKKMYGGEISHTDQALVDCLHPYVFPGCSILEIGCASGYYYEILEYLLNKRLDYTGVDYSVPLIAMAKDYYPKARFDVADGAHLPFADASFPIVISSGILPHVPNYADHTKEASRVAQNITVVHRTPVCRKHPTQFLKKFAYGVETVEIIYNEEEIIAELESNDLQLVKAIEYYSNPDQDYHETTYLFKKTVRKNNPEFDLKAVTVPSTTKNPLKFLNVGCGHRFHPEWTNIDLVSTGSFVKAHNIYVGIPYPNKTFDAVYHSHLLEHLPKRFAPDLFKECYRVLKPGGIIRVATPDLEQMARSYLDLLERSVEGDTDAEKQYEWILIELLDQMVRNQSGGEMFEYWKQNPMPAESYVIDRCGSEVLGALDFIRKNSEKLTPYHDAYLNAIRGNDQNEMMKIAKFRLSGEIHQWMYDRFSLKKLLKDCGFEGIRVCAADESGIPNFNSYLLDIEPNGQVRKPDSFFMEAEKNSYGTG